MKKQMLLTIGIALSTSLLTLWISGKLSPNSLSVENNSLHDITNKGLVHSTNYSPLITAPNFEEAAAIGVDAVVHVTTVTNGKLVEIQGRSFGDPFLDQFFGGGRRQIMEAPSMGSGSGVIISPDGYIVTNNHVVAGADKVNVTFNNRTTKVAKVVGKDPSTDIALLKIDETSLPYLRFANSDHVRLGQWVMAVGYPFTLDATVTAGIVSAKARALGINRKQSNNAIESFIQTDAAVNQGNSGGALINMNGELIGINSAIASPTGTYAGYSYAIPSNLVKKVAEDLKQYGTVQRAYLGIQPLDNKSVNAEMVKKLGLDKTKGVYINSVNENSGAQEAGLRVGDFITAVNGVAVSTVPELLEQIALYKPGDHVNIAYLRDGRAMMAEVKLKNISGTTELIKNSSSQLLLGANIRPLTKEELSKLKIKQGLMVQQVGNGLLAQKTKVRNGFIITAVNDKEVGTVEEMTAIVDNATTLQLSGFYPGSPGHYYYGLTLD